MNDRDLSDAKAGRRDPVWPFADQSIKTSPNGASQGGNMEPRSSTSEVNYLLWFVVIALAVAVGNILSTLAIGAFADYQARQALAEVNKTMRVQAQAARKETQRARQVQAEQEATRRQQMRQQRAADATGTKLGRTCAEWQEADTALNSYTTGAEVARHCGRYEQYLNTGVVPRNR
jgi:Tfp pilus assembly protein PilE